MASIKRPRGAEAPETYFGKTVAHPESTRTTVS